MHAVSISLGLSGHSGYLRTWRSQGRIAQDFTYLQLLQPVLTLGLLVLARFGLGSVEEDATVEPGDGGPLGWLVSGAILAREEARS